jgi:hypothetical protein
VGGQPVSAALEAALGRIDTAALALQRRIRAPRRRGRGPAKPKPPPQDKTTAARAELARLGVAPP